MPREINAAGYRLIKEFEAGRRATAGRADALAAGGEVDEGPGDTHGVEPGVAITLARPRRISGTESTGPRPASSRSPGGGAPNDNEFGGMVSLCFALAGMTGGGFPSSTVLRCTTGATRGRGRSLRDVAQMRGPGAGGLVDLAGLLRRRNVDGISLHPGPRPASGARPALARPSRRKGHGREQTVIAGGVAAPRARPAWPTRSTRPCRC